MSAAKETPQQKAERLALRRASRVEPLPEEQGPAVVPVADAPAVTTKNVRLTLDLATPLYDDFGDWNRRAARRLGRGRVTSADTLRVLLRRLLADEALAEEVLAELRAQG